MTVEEVQRTLANVFSKFMVPALQSTFEVQASTPVKLQRIEAIKPSPISGVDIIASLGIKSSGYQGLAALSFPSKTFLGILNRMLGENYGAVSDENADAASELMNILYGSARVKLNESGHDFLPAIPAVIRGSEIQLMHGNIPFIARLNCETEFGPFFMEMSLRSN